MNRFCLWYLCGMFCLIVNGVYTTASASIFSVQLINPAAHDAGLVAGWNAYDATVDGVGNGVINFAGDDPLLINTSNNLNTLDFESADHGVVGGDVIVNGRVFSNNFGGRSGILTLTDLNIETTFDHLNLRFIFSERFQVDSTWLQQVNHAAGGITQYGWLSGWAAEGRFRDFGQSISVTMTGGITPDGRPTNPIGPLSGTINYIGNPVTFEDIAFGSGPVFHRGLATATPPIPNPVGAIEFQVNYTVDILLTGGAPVQRLELHAPGSFDGSALAGNDSFGNIPEPATATLLALGTLALLTRRRGNHPA